MDTFYRIFGEDSQQILWWQMMCRGALVFFYTLLLIRIGGRRIFGKFGSFDIVLGIILGSIMSRALTGNASLLPTMATAGMLVALHWALAELTRFSRTLGWLIKGREILIIENGQLRSAELRKTALTESDVLEALRSKGGVVDVAEVKVAYLERSGEVSICLADD